MRSPVRLPVCAAAALFLAAPGASAQLELSWTEGVLGYAVTYELEGDPGELYVWWPSFDDGPTCLCLFDPLDSRSLEVGIDLVSLLQAGVLSPVTGTDEISAPLPAGPALSGLTLHAQAFTVPGSPTLVDDLSNPVHFVLSFPGDSHFTANEMTAARRFAPATTLADGRALVSGGQTPATPSAPLASTELFDPQTQSFTAGPALASPRSRHSATRLADGRVLLLGGVDAAGTVLASAELFDPATDTVSAAASMSAGRVFHSATLLADGRVFVAGGASAFDVDHPIGWPSSVTAPIASTTELYDPSLDTWTAGPSLALPLMAHAAVRLGDDRVLLAGGIEQPPGLGAVTTDACYLWDPAGGGPPTPTGGLPARRYHKAASAIVSGGALVTGGTEVDFSTLSATVHDDTYVYDHLSEAWSIGPDAPAATRCGELNCVTFIKTVEGVPKACTVYVTGGGWTSIDIGGGTGVPNDAVFQLDDTLTTWTTVGSSLLSRPGVRMAPVDDGLRFLLVGSAEVGGGPRDKTAELIVPIL